MSVWFGQKEKSVVLVPGKSHFVIEEVSGEWWLYSYVGDEDMFPPSTHKTEAAAKKRARRNARNFLLGLLETIR